MISMDLDVSYATALLAAVLLGVGFVLQQYAAEQEPDHRFLRIGILTDLLRKPRSWVSRSWWSACCSPPGRSGTWS
jgi:hypothetical protein